MKVTPAGHDFGAWCLLKLDRLMPWLDWEGMLQCSEDHTVVTTIAMSGWVRRLSSYLCAACLDAEISLGHSYRDTYRRLERKYRDFVAILCKTAGVHASCSSHVLLSPGIIGPDGG